MLRKLRQQIQRWRFTSSNRLPNRRARQYLLNYLRTTRYHRPSAHLRAAMGLIRWTVARSFYGENRVSLQAGCFLTGRMRGTSQRFTISRTRVKRLSDEGKLFGVRKSSW